MEDMALEQASEAFLARTMEQSPFAMWIADAEGTITRTNRALRETLQVTDDQIVGKYNVLNDHNLQGVMAQVRAVFEEQKTARFSISWRRDRVDGVDLHGGSPIEIDAVIFPIVSEQGRITNVVCQWVDITERRRVEATLRESEAQLSNALKMARAGAWEYDVDRDLFTFNDNLYRIFRTTAAEVGGYEMSAADYARRFCYPEDVAVVGEETRAAIESSDPNYERQIEHRILYADGEIGFISVRFFIVKDARGRTVKTYGVNQDITARKQMEARLAQSDRLASMGMLAAGVAHEINNPLTYVLYNLERLADDMSGLSAALRRCPKELLAHLAGPDEQRLDPSVIDDLQHGFDDALQGTRRIKDIAHGLGAFSRVQQDRLVPVDLMHVIEVASAMAFNEIKYRCRLVKDYAQIPSIMANDGRLSQVFLNLILNAAHAIDEGNVEANEIHVRTWQEGNHVCVEVRDTGMGIAPQHLPHLFEPFFTTKEIGVGTGLGLPISKSIVESFGGQIEVTSEVGQGTRFVVRLPIGRPEHEQVDAGPTPREPAESAIRGRILVIDDEAAIRAILERMLGREHEVVTASDGKEGLRVLEGDADFDVVLCDLMMPELSGADLHQWLIAARPSLARNLIFITGGAFTPRVREHLRRVDNPRVEKPFDAPALIKIVREMVRASRRVEP